MLANYFILTIRHLRRNGRYLAINVLGLGVAIAFCILAFLGYQYVHQYDSWHRDADRIARVEIERSVNDERYGSCPGPLGPEAATSLKEIAAFCRFSTQSTVVKIGDNVLNSDIAFTDTNFFQFFDFELVKGSASIDDPNKVILDEASAEILFGKNEPVGQSFIVFADTDHPMNVTVGGVVKKIPMNSSLQFYMVTNIANATDGQKRIDYNQWDTNADALFLKMNRPEELSTLSAGIQQFIGPFNSAHPDRPITGFHLQPLKGMAKAEINLLSNNLWHTPPPAAISGQSVIALLLLLTAALNFANMTIAVCNRRLREMGVRKVMGGTRMQIGRQLLLEAMVVVAAGAGMGMILAYPIVNWFNSVWTFMHVEINYQEPTLLLYVGLVIVLTTLLGGIYPAFYLSSLKPSSIFRGSVLFGGSNIFSRVMMGVQIAISVMSIVVGVSFAYNAEYNRTADIGYDYQPVLQAYLPKPSDYRVFNEMVKTIPGVVETGASVHLPGFGYDRTTFRFRDQPAESMIYQVGNAFTHLMRFRLAEGAWPVPAGDTTESPEVVVNQTFVKKTGNGKPVIGELITHKNKTYRIAGVVEDFLTNRPFIDIQPAMLHPVPERDCYRCLVRTAGVEQMPAVMRAIEKEWKKLFPFSPFNVLYQKEMMRQSIEASENIASNMFVLSIVAILLSVTGLFSLVSLNILRRMREVAIRRVMGAGSWHISWILNKQYLLVFGLAITLGCWGGFQLASLLMNSIFKFNNGIHPGSLVYSALGMLTIATLTIGLQIWQTLKANPADVLRSE